MVQKLLEQDAGQSIEWLLEEEKEASNLKDDQLVEIVAELENNDFNPLKPFEERGERHRFSPLKHRRENSLTYSSLLGLVGIYSGMMAGAALSQGDLLIDMHEPVGFQYFFLGGFVGGYVGYKIGKKAAEKVEDIDSDDASFLTRSLESEFQPEVYEFIENSDFIESVDASSEIGSYGAERPEPIEAAKAYQKALEELEEERSYWEDQIFVEDYELLDEEGRAILDSYDEKELEGSSLAETLKAQGEVHRDHREMVEEHEEQLEESEISVFLKYNSFNRDIEAEDTETFVYEGVAYEIEIYQGEDRVMVIDGVNSESDLEFI